MVVFGTRPEAIKMAPIVKELESLKLWDVVVCVTGQHREMLDQVMMLFEIKPMFDLDLMRSGQDLSDLTCGILSGMSEVFQKWRPDLVLVHGDTTTAMATSLAAFYARIPIGHIEAGLRTENVNSPWPEELNRRLIARMAHISFAPTNNAKKNLLAEGNSGASIYVTGNTVIDSLISVSNFIDSNNEVRDELDAKFRYLDQKKRLIMVTGHRRESFGEGFKNICRALCELSKRDDVQVVFPVHLNPNIQGPVHEMLAEIDNVYLLKPLDYLPFVYLMKRSYLLLTDSGGIQEEAPALGKPVLVMRETTERPEAISAGTAKLVGTSTEAIKLNVISLLEDENLYLTMSKSHNPYGDGNASRKIAQILISGI